MSSQNGSHPDHHEAARRVVACRRHLRRLRHDRDALKVRLLSTTDPTRKTKREKRLQKVKQDIRRWKSLLAFAKEQQRPPTHLTTKVTMI